MTWRHESFTIVIDSYQSIKVKNKKIDQRKTRCDTIIMVLVQWLEKLINLQILIFTQEIGKITGYIVRQKERNSVNLNWLLASSSMMLKLIKVRKNYYIHVDYIRKFATFFLYIGFCLLCSLEFSLYVSHEMNENEKKAPWII